jgi:two-component system sensor histidine kinase RegB
MHSRQPRQLPDERPAPGTIEVVDPALAFRWLSRARRGTLAAQVALMLGAEAGTQLHLHTPGLLAVVAGWAVVDAVGVLVQRRGVAPQTVLRWGVLDLAALTAILALSGGPHNPLLFVYLAWLALLATVLPSVEAWGVAILAMILEAAVVLLHFPGVSGFAVEPMTPSHLLSHVVTFDVSATAIAWIVTRLSAALREREAAEREIQRRLAITDRLAALGTLASGVAHELGTPLGAIQLLAEDARRRLPDQHPEVPLATLVEQVDRCRSILDRLRGRDTPTSTECRFDVERWVTEWRRAAPEVAVTLAGDSTPALVVGAEENWRAALWVAMDNARRAGARHIEIRIEPGEGPIAVSVEDDGRGIDAEAARHAGEPFWTGWGGTGLGLFVARSFAQSVGGDVALEPGAQGARTRILMPRVSG